MIVDYFKLAFYTFATGITFIVALIILYKLFIQEILPMEEEEYNETYDTAKNDMSDSFDVLYI